MVQWFEKFESFGHHKNAKLRSFLDKFNFEYDFVSSTEKYKSGSFDKTILLILQNYEIILDIILPTLRNERKIPKFMDKSDFVALQYSTYFCCRNSCKNWW